MSPLRRYAESGYHIGACCPLDHTQRQHLQRLFDAPPAPADAVLGGRQSVVLTTLGAIGPVVVKPYARGGLVRHIVHRTYINWPRSRAEKEFHWLKTVRRLGIRTPQPIAFANHGRFLGQCWLITMAITGQQSLAHTAGQPNQGAIYQQVKAQIEVLIRHGIWHQDLHPGNILVDQDGQVYIIDFDKARHLTNRRLLKWCYIRRWRRAVAKYGLSRELARITESL